jgi:hypothetical protein
LPRQRHLQGIDLLHEGVQELRLQRLVHEDDLTNGL